MSKPEYEIIGAGYDDTSGVPRDTDIWYHCTKCDGLIPSVPKDNVGCECGNVFIDRDYVRLAIENYGAFEVVRLKTW